MIHFYRKQIAGNFVRKTRRKMAAIIAQITRANRERKKKKTYETTKCMYDLPPFDPHFDPMVHNKYLAR